MDKETLSNYGWIVILVLILAVMLALATPFGNFIAGAIKSTTAGFFMVNQNAMGAAGITIPGQNFGNGGTGDSGDAGDQGGNGLPVIGTSAEDCTWDEIKAISEAGKGDEYFNLGDTKTLTTTDGKTIVMEIIAFNSDTKADGTGTAGITWLSKELVGKEKMGIMENNTNGWVNCGVRGAIKTHYYDVFPEEVKNAIVSVNKTYYDKQDRATEICEDYVWIPSSREMFGAYDASGAEVYEDSGTTYADYFATAGSRIKYYEGEAIAWYLRTTYYNHNALFCVVETNGTHSQRFPTMSVGVALGFCT